ncbi:MAG: Gfo/Idh/MocA family oxidoreductase [Gemmatimonadetes bacterium]|nr:Gfo/Idh/MocA family oxidoreductase [Gemmatimonadota bacterium]
MGDPLMRLAIVGARWAGQRQATALSELAGEIQLTCLVDNDAAHLNMVAAELGVDDVRQDLRQVLEDDEIDAVSLCTPHALHAAQAIAAAEAGKHVLVEKPMALSVEEASAMIDAAETHGVRLYVAESATYQPMSGFLRDVVRSGRHIGEMVAATVCSGFRAPDYGYPARRAWLAQPDQGGTGTWMLHGIHTVAQLRHVFGDVAAVYAHQHRAASFKPAQIEATMSLQLTLRSGTSVHLLQSSEVKFAGTLGGYTIFGDRGSLQADASGCRFIDDAGKQELVKYPEMAHSEYAQEMAAFATWVRDGVEGPTTGIAERRSLAIVQAGYESAASGDAVDLDARFGRL